MRATLPNVFLTLDANILISLKIVTLEINVMIMVVMKAMVARDPSMIVMTMITVLMIVVTH